MFGTGRDDRVASRGSSWGQVPLSRGGACVLACTRPMYWRHDALDSLARLRPSLARCRIANHIPEQG